MHQRFYLTTISRDGDTVTIHDHDTIHQITNVLRLKKHDTFSVFSNNEEYKLILKDISQEHITATILETVDTQREPSRSVTLYQSLLKKDNFELILQKCTELGVNAFHPIVCSNTISREISANKAERYNRIIREATEQCGGKNPPTLEPLVSLEDALKDLHDVKSTNILAWEGEKERSLVDAMKADTGDFRIFIGPEGGFTAHEVQLAKDAGITCVSLGNRILRAETAAVAATSILLLS